MLELGPENVVAWLRAAGRLDLGVSAEARLLAWGVSNVVLRISPETGDDFVVKQSRKQLRTQVEWFSRLDRIWREADLMRTLGPLLPAGFVPRVLFEDRENYLFGMEAVAADHCVWKGELLEGRTDPAIAATLGERLAALHAASCGRAELRERWGDREVFDQLRIDPFYRRVAAVHSDLAPAIGRLIEEMLATAVCVVHADFSPKNVLITRRDDGDRLALVDYETGHYGDPAFDLGFFLSHLLLKTVLHAAAGRRHSPPLQGGAGGGKAGNQEAGGRRQESGGRSGGCYSPPRPPLSKGGSDGGVRPSVLPAESSLAAKSSWNDMLGLARAFWARYDEVLASGLAGEPAFAADDLPRRTVGHLAGCLLARIDGKSTVDYLDDEGRRFVRRFGRRLFLDPPTELEGVFERLEQEIRKSS